MDDSKDLLNQIMTNVGLDAFNCEELFDLPDARPTRPGLIHLLQKYHDGHLTLEEIVDWADNQICWEVGGEITDLTVKEVTDTLTVADIEPENGFTSEIVKHLIHILKSNEGHTKELVAINLAFPWRFRSFCYRTKDYREGKISEEEYSKYIQDKFDLSLHDFPYQNSIRTVDSNIKAIEAMTLQMLNMKDRHYR
jgi:hypothetical protein